MTRLDWPPPPTATNAALRPNAGRRRVLVVDDDPLVRRTLARMCAQADLDAVSVGDGLSALAAMGEQVIDLVISDVRMPAMDGLELLRAIRGRHASVPVILVTGTATDDERQVAREQGAFDYLGKPLSGREFLGAVRAALSIAAATRP